jgi:predicted ATPase
MPRELPSGTVTFLFTDIEGSTKLLHELGAEAYAGALAEHRRILRAAFTAYDGVEVDTQGDAFFVAFPTAPGALAAATQALDGLAGGPIRMRMGLHTGTPHLTAEGYVGADVHRAARVAAAGHGGQVLVSAATASLIGSDGLRDLGEHRLKDLSAPERIYQFGDDEFSPLKSLHQTNLPVPVTPFLGRAHEVTQVTELLTRERMRLVTLTGPGGTGKSRLALQAAAAVADRYPDGVWWVPLAVLRDPELVLSTVGQTLGAQEGVIQHVGNKRMLVLLDNFEQVIDAADEVAATMAACPNLDFVVTSREPLHIGGEQEYPVPPLAPDDGVDLFIARARAVRPDFESDEAVPGICRRLDELPLAIELAAARVRALTPMQILERLERRLPLLTGGARDLPERQRTLQATIEWSHELLTVDEQRLFARLAVFRGGATLAAAELIVEADLDPLQSLVDKSLLRYRDERFWMLETIREFADDRLRESDELEAVSERHVDHFVRMAETAYAEIAPSASAWLAILGPEHDNLRAALDWSRSRSSDLEAQLAGAVSPYWLMAGHVREAQARVAEALCRHDARDLIRARALTELGRLRDDENASLASLDAAIGLWRELGDVAGEALAHEIRGYTHIGFGRYAEAQRALEQSLALREQMGAPVIDGLRASGQLCHVLVATGDIDRAEPRAIELYEMTADYPGHPIRQLALHFLADCALLRGDFAEAEQRYLRSLAYARTWKLVYRLTDEVLGFAMSTAGRGDHPRAVRLATAALAEDAALGFSPGDNWWTKLQDRFIGAARLRLAPTDLERAERQGRAVPFEVILDEIVGSDRVPLLD